MVQRLESWLERYRSRHVRLMAPVTLAIAVLFAIATPLSDRQALSTLAVAIAVFGLPHGALDHLSGRKLLEPRLARGWIPAFVAGYLALALVVGLVWWQAPRLALAAFLTYSAWHFGAGDAPRGAGVSEGLARGSMPIALPALFHAPEVTTYFNWLLPAEAALASDLVFRLAAASAAVAALVMLVSITARASVAGLAATAATTLELGALALLFAWAPPLISFLVYFCGWHSIRHLFDLGAELSPEDPRRAARRLAAFAWPLTLLTVAAAWPAWWLLREGGLDGDVALARVVFIGLAALTVPHMMLGWLASQAPAGERNPT